MSLLSIGRITLEDVLKYELSPIPLSLYENTGEMRASQNEVDLKIHFKWRRLYAYDQSLMLSSLMAVHKFGLYHGQFMALLWAWEKLFITLFLVLPYLAANTDVYLVFDRYYKYSIKGLTKGKRTGSIASNHVLSLSTPIPLKEDTMLSTRNKVQIISIISKYLIKKVGKLKL